MKRFRKHPARSFGLVAVVALVSAAVAATAFGKPTVINAGNLLITIDGSVTPKKLSKKKLTPITLNVEGNIKSKNGEHVPPLRTISIDFDKHGTVFTKGLPTCSFSKVTNTLTSQALRVCRKALVGRGKVSAEVKFPDQDPIPARGTLLLFNGKPKGGKPTIIAHSFVNQPVSATVVSQAIIKKAHGKYGTNTTFKIPPIASGQGSLTSFSAKVHRTWTWKHKKRSYVLAKCANGHFFAHGEFNFADGTSFEGNVVKPCKAKK